MQLVNYFKIGTPIKVKLNAKNIKPELRGRTYYIKQILGSIEPFHYLVETANQKQYIFKGDELQSVFAYDMELLEAFKEIKRKNLINQ